MFLLASSLWKNSLNPLRGKIMKRLLTGLLLLSSVSAFADPISNCEVVKAFEERVALTPIYRGSEPELRPGERIYRRCYLVGSKGTDCEYKLGILNDQKTFVRGVMLLKNSAVDLRYTRQSGKPIESYSVRAADGTTSVVTFESRAPYGFSVSIATPTGTTGCSLLDE